MRLRITHDTLYRYDEPAQRAIQTLRLTPRTSGSQFVDDWRIDVSEDCRLQPVEDAYGNLTHSFSVDGPITQLVISASGEVTTEDAAGMVRDAVERVPLALFRRATDLTRPDAALGAFAHDVHARAGGDTFATLHAVNRALHERLRFDTEATRPTSTAVEAFAAGHGVCQDFAHVFVACARALGLPARYVGGYLWRADGENEQEAGHAWAEAHVDGYGWIGFDPANDICPTDAYVRVACGLDVLDAAPIRGIRLGGAGEEMRVRVTVRAL